MNLINKSFTGLFVFVIIITVGFVVLSSRSSGPKGQISAVLQAELNLSSPPPSVSAISTSDQPLPDGTTLPRGAKLLGSTSVDGNNLIISFDSVQTLDGQTQNIIGKLVISKADDKQESGISAKLGKTLYNQSKSNVIGAIFYNPGGKDSNTSILPKGSILKIEVN